MSGAQILFVINMRLQAVRLGTVKIYSLKKKRILNTVLHVGVLLIKFVFPLIVVLLKY